MFLYFNIIYIDIILPNIFSRLTLDFNLDLSISSFINDTSSNLASVSLFVLAVKLMLIHINKNL